MGFEVVGNRSAIEFDGLERGGAEGNSKGAEGGLRGIKFPAVGIAFAPELEGEIAGL